MNGITHKQAQKYLRLDLDGLLTDDQRRDLETHLSGCEACRADAQAFSTLTLRLQSGFRSRWDAQDGPSKNVMANVRSQSRRIIMSNRISVGFKALGGIVAMLVFGSLINMVVAQMRDHAVAANAIPNSSAISPDKRLLAFASAVESDNLDIYTMYPDGSGLTNLTNDPAQDINPYWSPDGKRIAFMSDRDGFTDIYVMNADGSGLTRVTNNDQPTVNGHHEFGVSDYGPWSPDGSKLLFTEWTPATEKWKLYTVDRSGQNKTFVADVPNIYTNPSWSPDGKHIAYVNMDAAVTHLYVVGADGSDPTDVTQMVSKDKQLFTTNYTWTPEGNIRFVTTQISENSATPDYTLYETTTDGATLAEIIHTSTGPAEDWNGTIFVAGTSTLNWLRSDGSYREYKPFEKCQMGSEPQYGSLYKRSSHGYLFFAAKCPNGDWWFTWASPHGTQAQQLFDYPFPDRQGFSNIVWSSDDKYIALNAVSSNITYLYVIDVTEALKDPSTQLVKIPLMGGEQYSNISWQPVP
ncbi:MAG: DPP IV N-terminal domain-containing protein [Anaerolineales bacterium]